MLNITSSKTSLLVHGDRWLGQFIRTAPSRCTRVAWSCQARGRALSWSKTPIQRGSSVAALSSDATERSTMTATEDAYRFEFVWIDGDRLPFDA